MLIVEDDHISATSLRLILNRMGWDVCVAGTVAEGLASLNEKIAAVVLDMMLPDGNGSTILVECRRRGTQSVRVVITTGISDPSILATMGVREDDLVLRKPIDLEALLRALQP